MTESHKQHVLEYSVMEDEQGLVSWGLQRLEFVECILLDEETGCCSSTLTHVFKDLGVPLLGKISLIFNKIGHFHIFSQEDPVE